MFSQYHKFQRHTTLTIGTLFNHCSCSYVSSAASSVAWWTCSKYRSRHLVDNWNEQPHSPLSLRCLENSILPFLVFLGQDIDLLLPTTSSMYINIAEFSSYPVKPVVNIWAAVSSDWVMAQVVVSSFLAFRYNLSVPKRYLLVYSSRYLDAFLFWHLFTKIVVLGCVRSSLACRGFSMVILFYRV